ncbi:MAG: restriction endonuclease [Dehalococcoidia bacterium]
MATGPVFVRYFQPVLAALDHLGGSGRPREVTERVAEMVQATPADLLATTKSGTARFENQVAWARFYLAKAGLIDSSSRGVWALSEQGAARLAMTHEEAVAIFRAVHQTLTTEKVAVEEEQDEDPPSPAAASPSSGAGVPATWKSELLTRLQSISPAAFEQFCQRLLRESGFQSVEVTGKSGDGGIDGIGILEVNALVSFKVLFQCKRFQGAVGSGQVRDFRGAMSGRTDKGIIITTGTFTSDARREAVRDGVPPIELVDSEKLVSLCEQAMLGVKEFRTLVVDEAYFEHL